MGLSEQDRVTVIGLGMLALLAMVAGFSQQAQPRTAAGDPALAGHWDQALAASRQIDVNTASVAELERLPGIGPTLARRIVADRQAHGPFTAVEDLSRVDGIGPKTSAALEGYITAQ